MYDHIDDNYYKPEKTYKSLDGSYAKYQSDGDKDKRLSIEECFNMIKPYLSDIIIDHKDEWKVQISMKINFVPSKDSEDFKDFEDLNKTQSLYTNSDNIVIMIGYDTYEIIDKLFKPLLKRYQEGLEEKMKVSDYIFESADLLHFRLHKIIQILQNG